MAARPGAPDAGEGLNEAERKQERGGNMRTLASFAAGLAAIGWCALTMPAQAGPAHQFDFPGITGEPLAMADYAGKAVLVVNTASFCGFTPQYTQLQALWERYREQGLVVLGVPSNDFGSQEPGDEAAIQTFCEANYGIDFPMTAKQRVIGEDAHPFYRWIEDELGAAGTPKWNFHKYLIDGEGVLAGVWSSRVTPLSDEITGAVEQALP